MATKTIADYTAAVSIDGTNDFLLIEQAVGPIYKKISRSVLLGVTGQPVDISTVQTLTNKVIGITNTITQKDGSFTLQNTSDTTKQANFSLAGNTTSTVRTYTLPNASVTLASLTGTETLTNKTITSPTITGGTYDNGTITVDSISGHSTSTIVTVGGVQMNNGVVNTSNAVVTATIADSAITPAKLLAGTGTGWAWQNFTPTVSNFTAGNGTLNFAKVIQIGKTVFVRYSFSAGNTTAFTGTPDITLPVTSVSYTGSSLHPIGQFQYFDASVGAYYTGVMGWETTTSARYCVQDVSTYTRLASVTASIPAAVAVGDLILLSMCYEAA